MLQVADMAQQPTHQQVGGAFVGGDASGVTESHGTVTENVETAIDYLRGWRGSGRKRLTVRVTVHVTESEVAVTEIASDAARARAYRQRNLAKVRAADRERKQRANDQAAVVQRIVPANSGKKRSGLPKAAGSIFDLGRAYSMVVAEMPPPPAEVTDSTPRPWRPVVVAERDSGVTRVQGAQYPSNRWTAEREEQERVRRAKQTPPKPSKKARTKSAKLRDLIGGDGDA